MMRTIVDAGPLMKFGRVERVDVLRSVFGVVELVPTVEIEILRGLRHDPPKRDAQVVSAAISAEHLLVTSPVEENVASAIARAGRPGHDGESKSIDFLHELDRQGEEARFLTDDRGAADEAFNYASEVLSTLDVVHEARSRGLISASWTDILQGMNAHRDRFDGNILHDFIRRHGYDPFDGT